jgi:hypothetical protein
MATHINFKKARQAMTMPKDGKTWTDTSMQLKPEISMEATTN